MYNPVLTWSKCSKFFQFTQKEGLDLVKGYFNDDNIDTIKDRIKSIEKVPKKRIYDIEPGAGMVQRAQQTLQSIQ
jgi:ABC-type proline/glycine betaine transport system substrate-binding protein